MTVTPNPTRDSHEEVHLQLLVVITGIAATILGFSAIFLSGSDQLSSTDALKMSWLALITCLITGVVSIFVDGLYAESKKDGSSEGLKNTLNVIAVLTAIISMAGFISGLVFLTVFAWNNI